MKSLKEVGTFYGWSLTLAQETLRRISKETGMISSRVIRWNQRGGLEANGKVNGLVRLPGKGALVTEEGIRYGEGSDGRNTYDIKYMDDALPKPVVVLIHGGRWSAGVKEEMIPVVDLLVSHGYVTVNLDYDNISTGNYILGQIDQVTLGIRDAMSRIREDQGDPDRVILLGLSAGAQLAARAAQIFAETAEENGFRVIGLVDYCGPCDTEAVDLPPEDSYIVDGSYGIPAEKMALINPTRFVTSSMPPTLILHGTEDNTVSIRSSYHFYQALHAAGVPVFFRPIEGLGHGLFMQHYGSVTLDFLKGVVAKASPESSGTVVS